RAARDRDFLEDYNRALSSFDSYMTAGERPDIAEHLDLQQDLVAYFCAEFGLHESFPIYSGGLGILAGDHCKAASDAGLPFVAVGLLYREGYFTQTIDRDGRQQAHYTPADFGALPVTLALNGEGRERRVQVRVGEREVQLRIWVAQVGHAPLVLLDSDVPENNPAERAITHRLYGGDSDMRIQQEIVLGIGGVRALRALGQQPSVFHINEGHAAFLIFERMRELTSAGTSFDAALEQVAAATVFTTHTPVPAGHDIFNAGQLRWFLPGLAGQLKTSESQLLALGADAHGGDRFNMTALALRGSRFRNGVSRIHGGVARRMEHYIWPELAPEENPVGHVTNGVHMHTFIGQPWRQLFHDLFRGWRGQLLDTAYWRCIDQIPDERFIAVRRQMKRDLFSDLGERLRRQLRRNAVPEALIRRATRHVDDVNSKTLVLGFARRFATYKRALLILQDPQRLARMLGDPEWPALLVFAGKAHPRDQPGQQLIQRLYQLSMSEEFIGRLIMIEGYDMLLARNLVQGCDVWLNTPEFPLEASGTSGQKAGINGTVNVSVLDGWWAEGYDAGDGGNGFAIAPVDPRYFGGANDEHARAQRDREEGRQLLDILEHEVIPTYYGTRNQGYAEGWLRIARNSMRTLIPRYTSARMLMDYVRGSYGPAARHGRRLARDGAAERYAQWKSRVLEAWPGVRVALAPALPSVLVHGQPLQLEAEVSGNGLHAQDLAVECLLGHAADDGSFKPLRAVPLLPRGERHGKLLYGCEVEPLPGTQQLRVRARPAHADMAHPLELGRVRWA
ncbi:MAG TPA: alpha-glucan family phosphorylase, partial [Nevskiaceae bacterium]|nr:alpha-glucan family phosphorylase [Nevskiaceae bacterium]